MVTGEGTRQCDSPVARYPSASSQGLQAHKSPATPTDAGSRIPRNIDSSSLSRATSPLSDVVLVVAF